MRLLPPSHPQAHHAFYVVFHVKRRCLWITSVDNCGIRAGVSARVTAVNERRCDGKPLHSAVVRIDPGHTSVCWARVSVVPETPPPLPDFTRWPSFPFEGDLRVKPLAPPVDVEPPRGGEDAADCVACQTPDEAYIWVSERWRVRAMDRPTGLPIVLVLECRSHLDLGDLPNLLAAELGVMTVRLERAVRSLDGVARVHVNRWGDGAAHLHMWFLARPYGRLQLRGTFLTLWDDILPVIPEHQWRENLGLVAAWLAEFGGRAVAEPPHIAWQSPGTISEQHPSEASDTSSEAAEPPGGTDVEAAGSAGPQAAAAARPAAPAGATAPAGTTAAAGAGADFRDAGPTAKVADGDATADLTQSHPNAPLAAGQSSDGAAPDADLGAAVTRDLSAPTQRLSLAPDDAGPTRDLSAAAGRLSPQPGAATTTVPAEQPSRTAADAEPTQPTASAAPGEAASGKTPSADAAPELEPLDEAAPTVAASGAAASGAKPSGAAAPGGSDSTDPEAAVDTDSEGPGRTTRVIENS